MADKARAVLALAILAVALAACSGAPAATTPLPVPSEAVVVRAMNIAFEPAEVYAPAGEAFDLYFDNEDRVPHDVVIATERGERLFTGEIFSGPAQRVERVEPLPAGTYRLLCSVHPDMRATLVVR